jgi:alkaline phosphatase D
VTRREFLRLLKRSSLALPSLATSGCAPLLTPADSKTGLSLGYVAGDVTSSSAVIWARAQPGTRVELHYSVDPGFADFRAVGPYAVDAESDYTVRFDLHDLPSGTPCFYRAAVVGKVPGRIARFRTAPLPGDHQRVVFCFSGDTRESYQPFTVMAAVREQQPDFFLHLGDTIYADRNGGAARLSEFWSKYRTNRGDWATQALHAETGLYVTWDDHEVADNYLPAHPLAPIGQRAFLDYWPVRRDPDEAHRIYRSFRWGSALELFILDTRQYRDPGRGTMLGQAQKQWLIKDLTRSDALFKFIATSVPMEGGGIDRWDGYPKERAEIIDAIRSTNTTGVIFLSADLHCAAIRRLRKSGGLKNIIAGPLGAPLNRITDGTMRRFEFFEAENFNFAKITVDPKMTPAAALVEFIDQDSRTFHRATIAAR